MNYTGLDIYLELFYRIGVPWIILTCVLIGLWEWSRYNRKKQFEKIAKEFRLTFTANSGLKWWQEFFSTPREYKKNILKGTLNGHVVVVFDEYLYKYQVSGGYYRMRTIVSIDGKIEESKFFSRWRLPARIVRKKLLEIRSNTKEY